MGVQSTKAVISLKRGKTEQRLLLAAYLYIYKFVYEISIGATIISYRAYHLHT